MSLASHLTSRLTSSLTSPFTKPLVRTAVCIGVATSVFGLSHAFAQSNPPRPPIPACTSQTLPAGAQPPATPIWCQPPLLDPISSASTATNGWVDEFNIKASPNDMSNRNTAEDPSDSLRPSAQHSILRKLSNQYAEFTPVGGSQTFQHQDHWMPDLTAPTNGGTAINMIRPTKTFTPNNGVLVIETEFASAIPQYTDQAWGEIDITTASAPTQNRPDGLYAYDQFMGHWTLGCRLQPSRNMTCALEDNTPRGANNGGRVWELSFFQNIPGGTIEGGTPYGPNGSAWRQCAQTDPDKFCRDKFRLEVANNRITLFVNGVKYQEHKLPANSIPPELFSSNMYVYFSSVVQGLNTDTTRFHWDRVAINPELVTVGPTTTTPACVATH